MLLRSKRICAEYGVVDGFMEVKGGVIRRIAAGDCPGARDLGDLRVIPGIFDTHNHGTQGYSLWDDASGVGRDLDGYLKGAASEGVTLVFPTLFSAAGDGERALGLLAAVAARVGRPQDGAAVAGAHFEGPYLNRVGEKGTRTPPRPIDLALANDMIDAAGGQLRLMGLAPELPGADELIDLLIDRGVTAAFTHTDCTAEQAFAAFDRGVSVATHLCNVMTGIHHRGVGGLGAALLDDRVSCELICDGLHVCNDMLRLILRAKPLDRIMMISDCTGYSGAPAGIYGGFPGSGGEIIVDGQGFVREPGGRLRGSSKPVLFGVGNLVENLGVDLSLALRLCSLNACRKYGFADRKGSLLPGKDADFVVISDDYRALETYVGGRRVFDRAAEGERVFNRQMLENYRRN
ncbi:MAG: amidohydrolase family protein [Oscillospiraceae bacterium]|nr:amidohydrolase family protein [Oscillospiraceae bacterium]